MLRKFSFVIILALMTSLSLVTVMAQGEPYTPTPFTPADNACYEGGSMWRENPADACISDWHWECGWYLARLENGFFTDNDMPSWCKIIYVEGQPLVEVSATAPIEDEQFPRITSCTYDGRPGTLYNIVIVADWDVAFTGQADIRFDVTSQLHGFQQQTASLGSTASSISYRFNFPSSPRPTVQIVTAHILDGSGNEILALDCPPLNVI